MQTPSQIVPFIYDDGASSKDLKVLPPDIITAPLWACPNIFSCITFPSEEEKLKYIKDNPFNDCSARSPRPRKR